MPATRTRCSECNLVRSRTEMSIFERICNRCFDAHYILCSNCGVLIRRPPHRAFLHTRDHNHLGMQLFQIDGIYYCRSCYSDQHDGDYWKPKPFDISIATYRRVGSKRKFGVEIETHNCRHYEELHDQTKFGCKNDPTICGREFDSPILYGDEGLDCISDFLVFAEEKNWTINGDCGCHTHYDMRNESDKELYRIAYAYALTYWMWRRCVPRHRRFSSYCQAPRDQSAIKRSYDTTRDFRTFAGNEDRYTYVNLHAYVYHTTFEVRLLEGTLDSDEICNWITIHCRFMDCVKELCFDELQSKFRLPGHKQFRTLIDLINDTNLTDWMATRARRIGHQPLRGPGSVFSN